MSIPEPRAIAAVRHALSPERLRTYDAAVNATANVDEAALELYAWHAEVSAALLMPLHVCEIVLRNAVADALEAVHGARWPWSLPFESNLPSPPQGYSPRKDLVNTRQWNATTGKVIAELKFVFWQKMFTHRHDSRIWDRHLKRVLPNLDQTKSVVELRSDVYAKLDRVRWLRNRIAHHEPIFTSNLSDDYSKVCDLIGARDRDALVWMHAHQKATTVIAARP